MQVIYSPEAEQDLQDIKTFLLNKEGFDRTANIIGDIIDRVESLPNLPERFPVRPELGDNIHINSVKNYNIYYRINTDDLQILRVLYGRRNVTSDLFG